MTELSAWLEAIQALHHRIRDSVVAACDAQGMAMADVARDDDGDTIFAIDRVSEELLLSQLERVAEKMGGVVLVAEGISGGQVTLPRDGSGSEPRWRVIVDPIDGTRELMYQKRSAWVLTGVAPNRGDDTSLSDIRLAVQTEIPLVKQHLSDELWAIRGQGTRATRYNRLTGERSPLELGPTRASSIEHGYAMLSRFFPGARDELAAIDEQVVLEVLGPPRSGKAGCFEDQYASTAGQLYELCSGRDRFIADLRPLMDKLLRERGHELGHCCHPYDLSAALVATELGVILTDPAGGPLDAPLSVSADVAWVGYANQALRELVEPALQRALREREMIG